MLKECIILAGGLGTRLQSAVPDLPKCMAPVAGRPFLFYVINYLRSQGIEKFIFSLGYRHEQVEAYLETAFATLSYTCSVEDEPLGTGGAILLACSQTTEKDVLVVNGDTLFQGNFQEACQFHTRQIAECTLLLKPMQDFDRYGVVETGEDLLVRSCKEKQYYPKGNINAGVYILNVPRFQDEEFPARFSFEKDYLEKFFPQRRIYGLVQDQYFIDIGIPEDYRQAGEELSQPALNLQAINRDWSLFLDRDGVINEDKPGSYIFNQAEFVFMEGAPALFKKLNDLFGHILVVTNQRGVGKGLMTLDDLEAIHTKMLNGIEDAGGKVDAIYFAPSLDNKDPLRKPNPGMAFRAKREFFT